APENEDAHERGRVPPDAAHRRARRPPLNGLSQRGHHAATPSQKRGCLAAALTVPMIASVFPEELTALRAGGLVFAALLIAFAVWRRPSLSNGAVLLAILGGVGLAIVSGTELLDALLSTFAFERGNGGPILGPAGV